jgi:hypothetical protein
MRKALFLGPFSLSISSEISEFYIYNRHEALEKKYASITNMVRYKYIYIRKHAIRIL